MNLKEWFYPHANSVAKACGMKEWEGRIPILVEDAWEFKEKELKQLRKDYLYLCELIAGVRSGACKIEHRDIDKAEEYIQNWRDNVET